MLESKHVADSQPGPRYSHHYIGKVHFSKTVYEPGMWQEMELPTCGGYAEIDTSHIQPVGTMIDPSEVLAPREPGWMSSEDRHPIQAGVYRRLAITPTEVWCARPRDRVSSVWALNEGRARPGELVHATPGTHIFLVHGTLALGDVSFAAPTHIEISSDEKTLVASELSFLFVWRTDGK